MDLGGKAGFDGGLLPSFWAWFQCTSLSNVLTLQIGPAVSVCSGNFPAHSRSC